jgi:hypothetical protein
LVGDDRNAALLGAVVTGPTGQPCTARDRNRGTFRDFETDIGNKLIYPVIGSMGQIDIEFEWERDAKGYRLAAESPGPVNGLEHYVRFPEGFPEPEIAPPEKLFLVPNGGTLIRYRADDIDLIFREFVNTPLTAYAVREFANRWGTLLPLEGEEAEPVEIALNTIAEMNRFVDAWVMPETDKRDKPLVMEEFTGPLTRARLLEEIIGPDGWDIGRLKARLIFDRRTKAPRTQVVIPTLATALYWRMYEMLTSDTVIRRCGHCNALFTAGVGTDRRLDAKFCSDEHRFLYHRLKNAPEPEPDQPRRRGRPRRAGAV